MKFEISGLIVLFKDNIGYSMAILDTSLILKWIFFSISVKIIIGNLIEDTAILCINLYCIKILEILKSFNS